MKKIIGIFLAGILTLTALSSCGGQEKEVKTETPEISSENQTQDETETTSRLYPEVPESTYNGYEFNFLTVYQTGADWVDWDPRDIYAEEQNGELINDAVYIRNTAIEEKFDIKIKETRVLGGDFSSRFRKSSASGDNEFDVAMPYLQNVVSYAQDGLLVDLNSLTYMNLSKPWWNQSCVEQMSVGKHLYFVQSDLTIIDNDAMEAMIFNKNLIQDYNMEDPYELVLSGKWTIDKLIDMCKGVSSDLNGDGAMKLKDDRFGLVVQRTSFLSYYAAAEGTIVEKDGNDLPYINFASERNYLLLAKITDMMRDKENVVDLHRYEGQFGIYDEQAKMFSEDRGLFMWLRMRIVENLRNMEADFGIIPLPKYDENQSNYVNRMNPNTSTVITILKTNTELERTSIILEALACESKYTLQPAYYELNLKGKYARDTESEAMLDIIYDNTNTLYDLAEIYNFGDFTGIIRRIPTHDGSTDYASLFEKYEAKMQKDIDKIIANYDKAGG